MAIVLPVPFPPLAHSFAQAPSSPSFDDFIAKERKLADLPGLSVGVIKNGQLQYAGGNGFCDLQNNVPANESTVYRIGSITKQFTATMIMQLVQEGKLNLDATLGSLLPNSPTAWQGVTVRQLLNHTAGIPSYTNTPDFIEMIKKRVTVDHINDNVAGKPLEFAPGSNWKYSNSGYILLGLIIEKLDGQSYSQALQTRILGPAGMTHTYFANEPEIVPHRASGYSRVGKDVRNASYINMVWPFSAGAIETSVQDLAKWDAALYGGQILKQSSLAQMWTSTKLSSGTDTHYGFGWQLKTVNGIPIEYHGGGINGFTSFIERAPSIGLSVVVLINTDADGANAEAIGTRLAELADPRLAEKVTAIQDDDPQTTAIVTKAIQSLLAGKVEESLFTPKMLELFTPDQLAKMKAASDQWGSFVSITLVQSEVDAGKKKRSYVVKFENMVLKGEFVIDSSGKIEDGRLHP